MSVLPTLSHKPISSFPDTQGVPAMIYFLGPISKSHCFSNGKVSQWECAILNQRGKESMKLEKCTKND
jgi:hypothetical protein